MRNGSIVQCDGAGNCARFAEGLGSVLGVKADRGRLWALSNSGACGIRVEFRTAGAQVRGAGAQGLSISQRLERGTVDELRVCPSSRSEQKLVLPILDISSDRAP
jgi:hypothetical protein